MRHYFAYQRDPERLKAAMGEMLARVSESVMGAAVIRGFGVQDRTIAVSPVGCAVFLHYYFDTGNTQAAHGRAPAVALGHTVANPTAVVVSYQGDGDLASIGLAEIVSAAQLGIPFTVIFVNNAIYGMTGGQMAPTTLLGQRTTSSPAGRDARDAGYPILMTEMLALLPGVAYAARGSVADPGHIGKTKAMIRAACQAQVDGAGFSIVEVLSNCPVGWGMTAPDSMAHLSAVSQVYPLGILVDRTGGAT